MTYRFRFLNNYVFIFFLAYIILLFTKILFLLINDHSFSLYPLSEKLYAVIWGVKFDFAVAAIIAFLATLADFRRLYLRFAAALLLSLLGYVQLADILYFEEAQRHVSYEFRDFFADAFGLISTAIAEHPYIFIGGIFLNIVIFMAILRLRHFMLSVTLDRFYILKKLLLILLTIFFIRGMFVHIPLNPWQASQIGDPQLAKIALNGSYSTLYTAVKGGSTALKPIDLPAMPETKINENIASLYAPIPLLATTNDSKPMNIVLIFLESWPANRMASYGYPIVTTPHFDAILDRSIRPKAMIASGHRTTEGIFSAITSYPNPLGETVAKSQLHSNEYQSIIKILKNHGYKSAFFQGSSKETSGTGSFAQSLGFQESYGKEAITERRYGENYWGVYDQDLYRFVDSKISGYKEPFVIGINTNTTHASSIPDGVSPKKFVQDSKRNAELNALHFADQALGEFIERCEKKYPNTLFVLFSDHTARVTESTFENYLIPFALYSPSFKPQRYEVMLSQRDIAPTVLDTVGLDYRKYAPSFTGKSLIRDHSFFADFYANGVLGWVEEGHYDQFDFATGRKECFEIESLKPKKSVCDEKSDQRYERALAFTRKTQALLFDGKTSDFVNYRP